MQALSGEGSPEWLCRSLISGVERQQRPFEVASVMQIIRDVKLAWDDRGHVGPPGAHAVDDCRTAAARAAAHDHADMVAGSTVLGA